MRAIIVVDLAVTRIPPLWRAVLGRHCTMGIMITRGRPATNVSLWRMLRIARVREIP
jgi:hypothetical protein